MKSEKLTPAPYWDFLLAIILAIVYAINRMKLIASHAVELYLKTFWELEIGKLP